MEARSVPGESFDHLRERSIGLPEVLFQSITHMAPAAAVAFSILVSVGFAGQALPLAVRAGFFTGWCFLLFEPLVALLLFLIYQFKDWPDNPLGYGNWVAIVWVALGIVLTFVVSFTRPQAMENADRIFIEEEPVGIAGPMDAPGPA
jgi:hypothetical protein